MIKKIITISITILCCYIGNSQNVDIKFDYADLAAKKDTSYPLSDNDKERLSKTGNADKVNLIMTSIPNPFNDHPVCNTVSPGTVSGSNLTFDVTNEIRGKLADKTNPSRKLIVKSNAGDQNPLATITVKWKVKLDNNDIIKKSEENREAIMKSFTNNRSFVNSYNYKDNEIDLFFNEDGRLLNYLPVNVDQNDIFYFHILSKKEDKERYRIDIIEGIYAPSDLAIRPFDKVTAFAHSGGNEQVAEVIEYQAVTLKTGPFTSDEFKFQIAFDSLNGTTKNGPAYSVKINKLYHVGVGVSIVRSALENPEFRVAPLTSDTNTIEQFNEGARTLFTFNVIWYWSILQQKAKGSVITNGRDVLKDEPTWSLTRIFPTIGVTLDNTFNENFFGGFVYEFARGGSFVAGIHYGRIRKLADKEFELNTTPYFGTTENIRLNNVYRSAFFFGVNVDTRILNTLFGRGQ